MKKQIIGLMLYVPLNAYSSVVTINSYQIGRDCKKQNTEFVANSKFQTFSLKPNEFNVKGNGKDGFKSIGCTLDVLFNVPDGLQITVVQHPTIGIVNNIEDSRASVIFSVSFPNNKNLVDYAPQYRNTTNTHFTLTNNLDYEDKHWSECGSSTVRFSAWSELILFENLTDDHSSIKMDLSSEWKFQIKTRKCETK